MFLAIMAIIIKPMGGEFVQMIAELTIFIIFFNLIENI